MANESRIRIPNNWIPRRYQRPLWNHLEQGGKRAVAVWHRRAGKDEVCLHYAATAMVQKAATYWHMLPEATQARKAIWEAVNPHTGKRRIDEAFPKEIRAATREQEMLIKLKNGATWQVVGSDNYDSLVGSPPFGVIFSEWALSKPDAWAYLRPILAENGGWALFVYTPRGNNHGKKTYDYALTDPDWFCELLTADETTVFSADALEKERLELIGQYGESRGNALYKQEYYCSWSEAFTGKIVYPEFSQKWHVATQKLLPVVQEGIRKLGRRVVRGWDNTGLSPACVLTYINTIGQWFWFKEFVGEDIGIVDFGDMVKTWCHQNLPADTEFQDIGDPAGRIRDSLKKSPTMYLEEECGISIEDGLQNFKARRESVAGRLTKNVQGEPALVVCPDGCPLTIEGFNGGYCYPEIGKTGMYHKEPLKNKYSHPHDAGQYPATRLFPSSILDPDYYDEYEFKDVGRNNYGGY